MFEEQSSLLRGVTHRAPDLLKGKSGFEKVAHKLLSENRDIAISTAKNCRQIVAIHFGSVQTASSDFHRIAKPRALRFNFAR